MELKNSSEKDEFKGSEETPNTTNEEKAQSPEQALEETTEVEDNAVAPEEAVKAESEESPVSEEKKVTKEPKEEKPDFSTFSKVDLINYFRNILDKVEDPTHIKDDVELVKNSFYKLQKAEIQKLKKDFIDVGNPEEDFKPAEDLYEKDLKSLLNKYKGIKAEFTRNLEEEKELNYQKKLQVIEEIKELVNRKESLNDTFHEFRNLQQRWRDIGLIPQSKIKDLWETYHLYVEQFYDYVKINKELRDLDLKKNQETKIDICERAEELLAEPNIIKAFNALQKLHDQWREVGPVPQDKKEEIWERFKATTGLINKKHQDYFEERKLEHKQNLDAKTLLCEKAEELATLNFDNPKDWNEKSDQLIELQKVWRTIGFAPKKDNTIIYERFRTACDKFFDHKREFYSKAKEVQKNNLQLKTDLCVQAEAMKDSTDWKKTTQEFIKIQDGWKKIGPVPRKYSDSVWKRFRAACDHFFNAKSEFFSNVNGEQVENLHKKEALIEKVDKFELTGNTEEDLNALKGFQREWTEIGHVPFKEKDQIQNEFRNKVNELFDKLHIDDNNREILKFKNKIESIHDSASGDRKIYHEREKYVQKLKKMESDLILLDNNIGFFANSKNAEGMIREVKNKIERSKRQIEVLKQKIRMIDKMED